MITRAKYGTYIRAALTGRTHRKPARGRYLAGYPAWTCLLTHPYSGRIGRRLFYRSALRQNR
jgi:hypothetical protein